MSPEDGGDAPDRLGGRPSAEDGPGRQDRERQGTGPGDPALDDLTERVVASRVLHRGRYLTFRIDTVERADGTRLLRDVCGHPGAVAIVALDGDGTVLLVRQFRSPAGEILLEVPAGTLDVDPRGQTEDPAEAARRELEEETGYRAARWRHLATFWTAPGFATEQMHLFLATGLRPADPDGRRPHDQDERLRLVRLPWREAVALAEAGEIRDAKSLVGLFWLARLQDRGEV